MEEMITLFDLKTANLKKRLEYLLQKQKANLASFNEMGEIFEIKRKLFDIDYHNNQAKKMHQALTGS